MKAGRILVAGIGNIFLGDDAFGVEVVKRLHDRSFPEGVSVIDFGIRGIDLTYALLEDYDQVILIDAVQRGGGPGTLYVIEPKTLDTDEAMETHEMAPAKVLAAARTLGANLINVVLVGCEPETFGSDDLPEMGLSVKVAAAVEEAASVVESLVLKALNAERSELSKTKE